ncbi:MAG TPA: glycosyltransferase [Flavipsychrobacter sp.]|nr:glycosyltransferase [Flavipsychrobacter sp.]
MRIFSLPGKETAIAKKHPVSIIICAKNEAQNLKQNLPAILAQRYTNEAGKPLFEVIVVNDASYDDTEQVLRALEMQYDNLWDVTISPDAERTLKGKKFALSKGIAHSGYDRLLLIDADCKPSSDEWLGHMIQPLGNGKEIVAGYGGYYTNKGLLNAFIRWETIHTFLQYSTYALAGKPYMAVGRNMACTKEVILKAQQSEIWNALPSGDDDLLVNIVANGENMAIVSDKKAFTYSTAKTTWKEWMAQKQRHLSTGKYYKESTKALLGVYGLSHTIMWLLFFVLLFTNNQDIALYAMLIRCFIYWGIWTVAANKLNEKKIIIFFPLFDIGWLIYNFVFSPYIIWKNKKQWK